MKKSIHTLLILLLFAGTTYAQSQASTLDWKKAVKTQKKIAKTGFETLDNQNVSVPTVANRTIDCVIGNSYYDLQTNNSIAPRLVQRPDGTLGTTWTFSGQTDTYSDRGAGYNLTNGSGTCASTYTAPMSERTGFSNYLNNAAGREFVVCHTVGAEVMLLTKMPTETTWTETKLPINYGVWWARAAVSGDNIHVIYLTQPMGNGGALVDGMDGKVFYSRSTDAGATWDIVDAEIPGVDSMRYAGISAEEYAIDVEGDYVAIGIFPLLGDKLMIKSDDNGTNWTMRRVQDFPIDGYNLAYTFDDIAHQYDSTFYPDSLAMFTGDGSGALIIDQSGTTHVIFSSGFISDTDFSDQGYTYYPAYNTGVAYWNEQMNDDAWEFTNMTSPDLNGDGTWGQTSYDNYADYGYFFCTQPSIGLDEFGTPHVVFTAPHELDVSDDNSTYFRKPFYSYLNSTGDWTDPIPVVNEFNSDFGIAPFQELLFPQIVRNVSADSIHTLAQMDYTQGINVFDGTATENLIQCYTISNESVSAQKTIEALVDMEISPNPASHRAVLNLHLDAALNGQIQILNQQGQVVRMIQRQQFNAGMNQLSVPVSTLDNGLYYIQLVSEKGTHAEKLVVLR